MICNSCGSKFSEQLTFCPYCAAPRGEPPAKTAVDKALESAGENLSDAAAKAKAQAEAATENLSKAAAKAKEQAAIQVKAAGESLAGITAKAKAQAEAAGENLNRAAVKAKEQAAIQAKAAGESLAGIADKAKEQAEVAGESLNKAAAKAKRKFDDAGGFDAIFSKIKRFLLFVAGKIKLFAIFMAEEFEENQDSPNFWADIGVITFLTLIIIILVGMR